MKMLRRQHVVVLAQESDEQTIWIAAPDPIASIEVAETASRQYLADQNKPDVEKSKSRRSSMMAATIFFLFHRPRIKEMSYVVSANGHIFFGSSDLRLGSGAVY